VSKVNEYTSMFLNSIQMAIDKNLSAAAFDKTIECEVVNIDKKDSGIYLVQSD
jgi:hypothetical protein